MYLTTFEICVLKYVSLILDTRMSIASSFKKNKVKLDLSPDNKTLLMIEKGIRQGICHSTSRNAKVNNKYMKDYDKNKESS